MKYVKVKESYPVDNVDVFVVTSSGARGVARYWSLTGLWLTKDDETFNVKDVVVKWKYADAGAIPMKTDSSSVTFTVEGDFITEHFRDRVLEGDYRSAIDGLKVSLIGISIEQVNHILSGMAQLTKDNRLVVDDKYECDEWLMSQYYSYFHDVIYRNKKFYKVYGEVSNLNKSDCRAAMTLHKYETLPIDKGGIDFTTNFNMQRAETYLKGFNDICVFVQNQSKWLLMSEVSVDYPIWLKGEYLDRVMNLIMKEEFDFEGSDLDELDTLRNTAEAARRTEMYESATGEALRKLGIDKTEACLTDPVSDYLEQQKEIEHLNSHDGWYKIKETVSKQADSSGGWLTLHNEKTDIEYVIPRNPFYRWVLSDSTAYDSVVWDCVSPRGAKMGGDDPNHTDWWLFTGLSLDEATDHNSEHNSFFFKMRHHYLEKLTNNQFTVLTNLGNHKGFERAVVRHVKTPKDIIFINKNDIIIIPNASPEFEAVAYKCAENNCVLITETGGKLCHLATVGREYKLTLVFLPDAMEKYPMASSASIDIENSAIKALEVDIELLMKLKMSGLRYR